VTEPAPGEPGPATAGPGASAPGGPGRPPRPSRAELQAAAGKTIPDVLAPGLGVLFVGINPGLYSAAVGHHFARAGNRFWPALHEAGLTPRLLRPEEDGDLPLWGLGITNLVSRATASAAELSADELRHGRAALEDKVARYAPAWTAFVGIGAYETAFGRKKPSLGLQQETIGRSRIWLLPNTSGLNAHYTPAMFAELLRELRLAAVRQSLRPSG
jgi:TDG/mug DNA glycosylase family protein